MTARKPAPRRKLVRHGTWQGYDKHRRIRKGNWSWPACEKCVPAATEGRRGYAQRPEVVASTRLRNNARQRAFRRLKDLHPGEFARLLSEEVSIARDGGTVVVSNLRYELRTKAPGTIEADLTKAVQQRSATQPEISAYFEIQDLRRRITEAEERVARFREPVLAS
jgi:hypothetical protein